jgi:hypothetical protein
MAGDVLYGLDVIVGSSYLNRGTRYFPEWWITFDQWALYNNEELSYNVNDIAILNVINRN